MQLLSADTTIYSNKSLNKFCPQKVEKNTLKSCSENSNPHFFSLLPWAAQTEEFMFQNVYRTGPPDRQNPLSPGWVKVLTKEWYTWI